MRHGIWSGMGAALLGGLMSCGPGAQAQTAGKPTGGAKAPAAPPQGAGLALDETASAEQLGLPLYPHAQLLREGKDEAAAFNMALWGGSFGFRIAVAQYRSSDSLNAVADFYRKAMAVHGLVLECRAGAPAPASAPAEGALTCRDADPPANGLVLKVGRPKNQRVVVLTPKGRELHLQLLRIVAQRD